MVRMVVAVVGVTVTRWWQVLFRNDCVLCLSPTKCPNASPNQRCSIQNVLIWLSLPCAGASNTKLLAAGWYWSSELAPLPLQAALGWRNPSAWWSRRREWHTLTTTVIPDCVLFGGRRRWTTVKQISTDNDDKKTVLFSTGLKVLNHFTGFNTAFYQAGWPG